MLNCFPKLRGALNTSLEFAFDFFDIPRVKFLEAPPECAFVQGLTQHNFTGLLQLGQSELLGKHLQWQGSALYRITQVLHGTFEHPPVIKRHRLVKHSTNNFPSQFEKMAFGNGIKAHTRQREFAEAFCAWVLPEEATQPAFEAFSKELDHLGCAKWPILTAYRFLLHPQTDVLIKPENLGGFKSEVQHLPPSKVRRCKAPQPGVTNNSSLKTA